jgi:hypothetical protein
MQAGLTEDRHCAISDYIGGWVDEIIQRIFVLAFNLIGDAFRDALDPKMSARVWARNQRNSLDGRCNMNSDSAS